MKKLIIAAILFSSCGITAKHISRTGSYEIENKLNDSTYTFKGYNGKYMILSDTLKAGDVIKINVIKIKP